MSNQPTNQTLGGWAALQKNIRSFCALHQSDLVARGIYSEYLETGVLLTLYVDTPEQEQSVQTELNSKRAGLYSSMNTAQNPLDVMERLSLIPYRIVVRSAASRPIAQPIPA